MKERTNKTLSRRRAIFPIRFKVFFLILSLILITLISCLSFTFNMFQRDKTSMIYETILQDTTQLAKTLEQRLISQINQAPYFGEVLLKALNHANNFIKMPTHLLTFSQLEMVNDRLVEKFRLQNRARWDYLIDAYPGIKSPQDLKIDEVLKMLPKTNTNISIMSASSDTSYEALWILTKSPDNQHYYLQLIEIHDLLESNRPHYQSTTILSYRDEIDLLKSNSTLSNYIDILNSSLNQGVSEIEINRQPKVIAHKKIPQLNLVIINETKKEEAFLSIKYILEKSIIFILLAICIATLAASMLTGQLIKPLNILLAGIRELTGGNLDHNISIKTRDEFHNVAEAFNYMRTELKHRLGESVSRARMEKEMETAQTVQETLFPATEANLHNVTIAGIHQTFSECGGDWWFYIEQENRIIFLVGDATGHGVPAALITASARTATHFIEKDPTISAGAALAVLNNAIYSSSKTRIMMTFFVGIYNKTTHRLQYANGSHITPVLFDYNNPNNGIKGLRYLDEVNGPRIGQAADSTYHEAELEIQAGSGILFYTDGMTDAENSNHEKLGEKRFLKLLANAISESQVPKDNVTHILEGLKKYQDGGMLVDDTTFFIAKFS